jgi:large subunit ribosomal protein L6
MSRVGKLPVAIPAGVKVNVTADTVSVEGPKGKLSQAYDPIVEIKVEGANALVTRKDDSKRARSCHAFTETFSITWCSRHFRFTKSLVITASVIAPRSRQLLVLNLGYSTDFIAAFPRAHGYRRRLRKITITGIRKDQVGEFAAEVRKLRGPEPYKGKGIRYETEVIKRKVGKSGVK